MEKEPTIEELKNFLGEYLELKGINTSSVFRCLFIKKEIYVIVLLVVKNTIFVA